MSLRYYKEDKEYTLTPVDLVHKDDIVDDLTTSDVTKTLSANQGIEIKKLISSLQTSISNLQASLNTLQTTVNSLSSTIISTVYPVGAVYMSTSSTSPSTLFGGTWESVNSGTFATDGTDSIYIWKRTA